MAVDAIWAGMFAEFVCSFHNDMFGIFKASAIDEFHVDVETHLKAVAPRLALSTFGVPI